MEISFKIGLKEKKPEEPQEKWYVEMYGGKPRYIVTDKNMYSEGYVRCGSVGDFKRWDLECIDDRELVLVEVKHKGKTK